MIMLFQEQRIGINNTSPVFTRYQINTKTPSIAHPYFSHGSFKRGRKPRRPTCSSAALQKRGPGFAAAQGAGDGTAAGKQSSPPPDRERASTHPAPPRLRLGPSPAVEREGDTGIQLDISTALLLFFCNQLQL